MRAITVSVGPLASAAANNIATSQTPSSALTINGSLASGGVATLDTPRRVLATTAGAESGKTLTVIGTDVNGSSITDLLALPSIGTIASVLDFKTVTSASISSAAAGAMTLGTNGVASTRWVYLDSFAPGGTAIQCTVTGTVNYTVQQSLHDPDSPTNVVAPYLVTWVNHIDPNLVAATTTQQGNYTYSPLWAKVTLNSGSGSVSVVFAQGSAAPY